MSILIKLEPELAGFAEDKGYARQIRIRELLPALDRGETVTLDFSRVVYTTQSFVHTLIGEALAKHGEQALQQLEFRQCSPQVRSVVELVVDYSLSGFPASQQA
jgi:hypothetical protein